MELELRGIGRYPLIVEILVEDFNGQKHKLPMPRNPIPPPDGGAGRIIGPMIPKKYRGMSIRVEVKNAVTGARLDIDSTTVN